MADRSEAGLTQSARPLVPGSGESTLAVSGPLSDADSREVTVPAKTVQKLVAAVRVDMIFRENRGAEVTDGNGQALYDNMGRAGTVANFEGTPPESIVLGDPAVVWGPIDGQPYPVPASDGDFRTSRFVLDESAAGARTRDGRGVRHCLVSLGIFVH